MAKELGFKFAGRLMVKVDRTLAQAILHLGKDGGEHWDEARLWKLLSDQGVKEGFDKDKISLLINDFQRSRETDKEVVIATGTLPTPAKPEEYRWAETLALPEELKDIYEKLAKKTPSPEVYQVRFERQGEERKEIRTKAAVSPKVLEAFFVEEGTAVAEILPANPGKPGRDLEGKPIQPAPPRGQPLLLGTHLGRQKSVITALTSGFLRKGEGWADLLPYCPHFWEVRTSPDNTNAWLTFRPGNPEAPAVSSSQIFEKATAEGIGAYRMIPASVLDQALARSLARKEALEDFSLTPDQDGSWELTDTVDKLKATLTVRKSSGKGKPIKPETILKEVSASGYKNCDINQLKSSLEVFFSSSEMELENLVVVQGKAPGRNPDRTLQFNVDFVTSEELGAIRERFNSNPALQKTVPALAEYPLTKVQRAAEVAAGTVVASFQASEEKSGEPGVDIFGGTVPPYPGNDPLVQLMGPLRRESGSITSAQDGLMEVWEEEGTTFLRLRPHRNARVEIRRTQDNMEAYLTLVPASGTGTPLTQDLITQALEEEQIREGINQAAVQSAFQAASAGKRVENVLIARGRAPGSDLLKRLTFLVSVKGAGPGKPPWKVAVKEGDAVAEFDPPTAETLDGIDVMGNLVPSDAQELPTLNLEGQLGTESLDGSTKIRIIAQKSGELQFSGQAFHLKDKIMLQGNLTAGTKFPGTILIDGNVGSGIYVMSGGELKIKGQAGGSLLSADASIQISGGVRGEGKAVLRAKKHIAAGFFEKCRIMSVGDTVIGSTSLGCEIRCNGKVIQKGEKGTVAGGRIKTKFGIDAVNLGTPQGTPTHISFGQDYLVEDQINLEETEIEKIRQGIVQLDLLMKDLEKIQAKEKLAAVFQKKVLMMKLLQKRGLRLINLRDRFEIHFDSSIIIRGSLFPGVVVESHGRTFETKTRKSALRLTFNQQTGHIEESSLG